MNRRMFVKQSLLATGALALTAGFAGCSSTESSESTSEEAATEDLKVVMELAYPPFETKDANGDPEGVSPTLARAFAESIERNPIITNTSWDGLIPSLDTGSADMIISSMTVTEDREQQVDFGAPYAKALLAFLTNIDAGVDGVDSLNQAGRTIAVKTGSTGHTFAQENLGNAEVLALADESACVQEVIQGKADAFIYDQLTIYRNSVKNPDTTKAVYIPNQTPEMWAPAFAKGSQLVDLWNTFLTEFRANGGFDDITQEYLAEEKEAFDDLGFDWFFDMED